MELNDTYGVIKALHTPLPATFIGVYFAIRIVISLLALAGNSLTIIAITKKHSLQNNPNLLVANLAVADLIQALLPPNYILQHFLLESRSYVSVCLAAQTGALFATRGNVFFIMLISIDRCLHTTYPLRYPIWITSHGFWGVVAGTWIYSLIDTLCVVYFGNVLLPGGICKLSLVIDSKIYTRYLLSQLVICIVITISCYIVIAKIAIKQGRAIAVLNQPYDTIEAALNRQQKKIAKMMFIVLASFLLCYFLQACMSVAIQKTSNVTMRYLQMSTTAVYYSNCFLNPIIYAWKSKEFRVAFKRILGMKVINESVHTANTNQPS